MKVRWMFLLLLGMGISGCKHNSDVRIVDVRIDPDTEFQRIHGFGTSMVNYKEFPPEYFQPEFLDMVVYDLGLSILRIPITEHMEFVNDDEDLPDHYNWDGFYLSDNNRRRGMEDTYRFVTELKNRGVDLFMASPWSPPQFMKTNRAPIQGGFLRADMYDEFAEYLSAYIMMAKLNWDVDINWISLQNESIFIEFYRSCLYHGYGMKEAVRAVTEKFTREGIGTRLLINEDILFPDRVHAFLKPVFEDPETRNYPGDIAVHRRASGEELLRWVDLTSDFGREYFMTETSGHVSNWKGALSMAVDMHEYLALGNFSSWIYWQLSGNTGGSNPGFYTLMQEGKPTPKYYAAKHFYRNIRPGALRIETRSESDSVLASAYKHPETGAVSVVLINPTDKDRIVRLPDNDQIPSRFEVNRSSEKEEYKSLGKYRTGEVLRLPACSMVSLTGIQRKLIDRQKVISYDEPWSPPKHLAGTRVGNAGPFPMESEWQPASDRHGGRYVQAEAAVEAGEIDHQRYDGWTLLHESILNGDGEAVNFLIANGADVNKPANDGWTPLHAAASGFVGNDGIQVKYKEYSHYDIFRMILESGADIHAKTEDGWTPLHCSVINAYTGYRHSESASLNRIRDLIREGADLEARDENGRTPLHWAAMQGYSHYLNEQTVVEEDVVEILVNAGARVDSKDNFGKTPLHYAVSMGYEAITRELVEDGANPDAKDKQGISPSDIAADREQKLLLEMLAGEAGIEKNRARILSSRRNDALDADAALIHAASTGDKAKLRSLLRKGADTSYRDGDGFRAIDRAIDNGYNDIVEILRQAENTR